MKHMGFTGTQRGCKPAQLKALRSVLKTLRKEGYRYQHNGSCIGADAESAKIWDQTSGLIHRHPPEDTSKMATIPFKRTEPAKPYLIRNHDIVDASGVLVATPGEFAEQLRSGTWATIRYARKLKKRVILVWPDGQLDDLA